MTTFAPLHSLQSQTPQPSRSDRQLTDLEDQIIEIVRQTRFGSLNIIVHDSRITQIESSEKTRFDKAGQVIGESLS